MDRITELNTKTNKYKVIGYFESGTFLKKSIKDSEYNQKHNGYCIDSSILQTLQEKQCSLIHFEKEEDDKTVILESEFEDWLINSISLNNGKNTIKCLPLKFWREPLESSRIDNKQKKTQRQLKEEKMATIAMHDPSEFRFCRKCEELTGKEPIMNCQSGRFWTGLTKVPTRRKVKIYILGEAPWRDEIADPEGRFLIGRSGRELDEWVYEAGVVPKDIYVDNVVRCAFPRTLGGYDAKQRKKIIDNCRVYLYSEISRLNPEIILPMGNIAIQALMGVYNITRWSGRHILHPKFKAHIIPMFHPAAILRGRYNERDNMIKILQYANSLIGKPHNFREPAWEFILDNKSFEQCLKTLQETKRIRADLEAIGTDNFAETAKIIGIALGHTERKGYFLPLWEFKQKESGPDSDYTWDFSRQRWSKKQLNDLRKIFSDKRKVKVFHNAGLDFNWLTFFDYKVTWPIYDTMIANSVLDHIDNGLKKLAYLHTDFGGYEEELEESTPKLNKGRMDEVDPFVLAKYGAYDVVVTTIVDNKQQKILKGHKSEFIINELMKLRYNLSKIELTGCLIDLNKTKQLKAEYLKSQKELKEELSQLIGVEELNFNSNIELPKALYDFPGILSEFGTERSTDKRVFEEIKRKLKKKSKLSKKNHNQLKIVEGIATYRRDSKFISTYLDTFLEKNINKRIFPHFNVGTTKTGRLSMYNPSLHNQPRKGGIRDCFIAEPGCLLVEGDASQVELRIAAELSQDAGMLEILNDRKGDIHAQVGQASFKQPDGSEYPLERFSVSGELRAAAKIVSFSIIYMKSVMGLAWDLDCTLEEAARVQAGLLSRFPALKELINYQNAFVTKHGYVETIFGRRLYIDEIRSSDQKDVDSAYRKSINYPVQSAASDYIIIVLNRIMDIIKKEKWPIKLLLTVHDSLLFNVPKQLVKKWIKVVQAEFERPMKQIQHVKIYADFKVGKRWGSAKEIKKNSLIIF